MIVVARRERQTSPRLAASLTRGVEAGTVLRLELGPLDRNACLAALAPDRPAELAAELYTASEGNPCTSSPCSRPADPRDSARCSWTS